MVVASLKACVSDRPLLLGVTLHIDKCEKKTESWRLLLYPLPELEYIAGKLRRNRSGVDMLALIVDVIMLMAR